MLKKKFDKRNEGKARSFRFMGWILSKLCDEEMRSSILEDLDFRITKESAAKGPIRARIRCVFQFIIIIGPLGKNSLLGGSAIFKNYLKTAFRNIKKYKGYSFINIFGLAVGMMVCFLMLMYVVNEMSFDNFHEKGNRIYRVVCDWGKEGEKRRFAGSMPALAPAMNSLIPEIEFSARVKHSPEIMVFNSQNKNFKESEIYNVDQEAFEIFTWNLLKGEKSSVLKEPFSIVITQNISRKYFNNENPIGKTLNIDNQQYTVTGLLEDLPPNTHLQCEMLISYSTLLSLGEFPEEPWTLWGDDLTYFVLRQNSQLESVEKKLHELLIQNTDTWFQKKMSLVMQPLAEIHWDTKLRGDEGGKGSKLYVYLFLFAAILVLVIACFNFMNLSTSRFMNRMREVGVKKVIGASRRQLINQFLVESLLVASVSMILGLVFFQLLSPLLYSYLGAHVELMASHYRYLLVIVVSMVVLVGLLAGSYPAWFLSRFRPVDIISKESWKDSRKYSFRNVLVILQFAITIVLILGTMVIFRQINFMKNSDLGFDKKDVILSYFPFANPQAKDKYPVLKDEFLKNQNVIEVTGAYTVPGINSQFQMTVRKKGAEPDDYISMQVLPADFGFIRSMRLKLIAGRDFSKEYSLDAKESVILNETAVEMFGFENPVGKRLLLAGNREVSVIGIVKDFHIKSLHNKINPVMLHINPEMYLFMAVKIKPENSQETLAYLEEVWKTVLAENDFNYRNMEDAYYSFYMTEERTGKLISIFTSLTLLISCLGLFGLASFAASKRIKEIGIRKVLGASTQSIFVLLSKEFFKWILVSNIIAWPVAYYLISLWLKNFVYRIELTIFPFVLSGAAALIIALITVSFQTLKASMGDPVRSLHEQ